jgi:MFS family permease
VIAPRAIVCLGLTQLIGWGVTFYLIGALGPAMTADLGWNAAAVYGGFSAAIVVMAMVSPLAGMAVDRWGGHRVMPAGAVIAALGCAVLAAAHGLPLYYLAWILLGIGMRLCLYDAAFASLARAAGPTARRPMSQITLLGGLASTVMWPVGHALAGWLGWRGAVLAYGGLAPAARTGPPRAWPAAPPSAAWRACCTRRSPC